MSMSTRAAAIAALATTTMSFGAPIDLTIDPARSSIEMTMSVDVSIASDTDSDSSPLSGELVIELDDNGDPAQVSLLDLMVVIDDTLDFSWGFGFFGSADASLSGASMFYAHPGVATGPVPVSAGAFAFPEIEVMLDGMMDVSYDILFVGSDSVSTDLGDQGPLVSAFSGDMSIEGGVVTIENTLPLDTTQPVLDADGNQLGTVTITGSATIVATGSAPACAADLNGDGDLNFFDVSAFLGAFGAMNASADFDANGQFNFFDVSAFLSAFSAGCP